MAEPEELEPAQRGKARLLAPHQAGTTKEK